MIGTAAAADDPAPSPTPTPAPAREGVKKGAKPAAKPKEPPPLKFDDNDLADRYHGKPPAVDSDEDEAATPAAESAAAPPRPSPAPGPSGKPAPAGAAPPKALPAKPPPPKPAAAKPVAPPPDPMKPFRDREANEKFRTEQIEGLRARIVQTQSRLDYLSQRRLAVLDPLRIPPKTPEGEAQIDPALKPKELLAQLDAEIETVTSEIDDLKKQLVTIETRFQRESGSK